jgi:diguanylate cyclase (GGDEF)-like protein/hemerythrin-like metal-binding protein
VICIALIISIQLLAPRFILPDAAGEAWTEAIASRAMLVILLFGISLRFRIFVTRLARVDALTQLPNRLATNERLRTEFLSMKRSRNVYAVLMMDVDFFKQVNDMHGHAVGDQVLQRVATTMKATLRESDFCARFGGEEFLTLLPATDMPAAYQVAEKLRQAVEASPDPIAGRITASIGLALSNPEQADEDIAVREADESLYRAKSAGRNQVQVAPTLVAQVTAGDAVPAELVQLVWRSTYESGNQTIDAQHRELFHAANRLLSAELNGLSSQDVTAMVDSFIAEVVQHFQDEESIITKAGYPGAPEHAILHRALVEKAAELATGFRHGTLTLGELFKYLAQDVVSRHMLTADREYFSYLKSHK